jgi:hypothetical protein
MISSEANGAPSNSRDCCRVAYNLHFRHHHPTHLEQKIIKNQIFRHLTHYIQHITRGHSRVIAITQAFTHALDRSIEAMGMVPVPQSFKLGLFG